MYETQEKNSKPSLISLQLSLAFYFLPTSFRIFLLTPFPSHSLYLSLSYTFPVPHPHSSSRLHSLPHPHPVLLPTSPSSPFQTLFLPLPHHLSRCLLRLASHNYEVSSTLTSAVISLETSLTFSSALSPFSFSSLPTFYLSLFVYFYIFPCFLFSFFFLRQSVCHCPYIRSLGISSIIYAVSTYSRLPVPCY